MNARSTDWDDIDTAEPLLAMSPSPPKKQRKPSERSLMAERFAFQIRTLKLPTCLREYRFAKDIGRQWRFDFCFPDFMIAVEIEGVAVMRIGKRMICTGRHSTPGGMQEDCEKYATAADKKWYLVRFMTMQVKSGYAIDMTQRILVSHGWQGAV